MRFWSRVALALGLTLCTGCESAKVTELYMARDEAGIRRTICFRPEWKHYYVFAEVFSAADDTLLAPRLKDGGGNLIPANWDNDELEEFQNFAIGKGEEILITIEVKGPEDPNNSEELLPLTPGNYTWEFYLDDHSEADDAIEFAISDACP